MELISVQLAPGTLTGFSSGCRSHVRVIAATDYSSVACKTPCVHVMAQMLQFHPVPFPLQLHSASQCVFAVSMLCALQVVGSSGEPSMQELSQPCHDCGAAHLPRTCQQPRCDISNSVCNRWAGWYRVYSHPNVDRAIGQWCSFAALPFQAKAQPDRSIACAPSSPHVAKV